MKIIGNILWFLFGGFLLAVLWFVAGLLCMVTIIGIPLGVQCMKLARLMLLPVGAHLSYERAGFGSFIGNLLWILVFGIALSLTSLVIGLVWCVTIIGIPFGLQFFKLAQLSLMPFGASIK